MTGKRAVRRANLNLKSIYSLPSSEVGPDYRTSQRDCTKCSEVFFPLRHSPKNQTGWWPLQAQIAQARSNQPINQPVLFGGLPAEEVPGREKQNCTHKRNQNPHRVCLWNRRDYGIALAAPLAPVALFTFVVPVPFVALMPFVPLDVFIPLVPLDVFGIRHRRDN